jgi:hypothetical protein
MVVAGGLLLLLATVFQRRTIGGAGAASIALAIKVFLPFLLLVFGVPTAIAALVWWLSGMADHQARSRRVASLLRS